MERLEQFLVANDIVGDEVAEKWRSVFISVVGPGTYSILKKLLAPEKPKDKSF